MHVRRCCGFSLLEIVVAIAVGGVVVLAAHHMFAIVADTADRGPVAARAASATRNRERLLRDLVASVDVGSDTSQRFYGQPDSVRFNSWCRAAGGWLERCTVDLMLVAQENGVALDARWSGERARLATHQAPARFMFLRSAADGGAWLARWGAAISAPLAVRVAWADTSIFLRIGPRG